ncbi:MAG: ISNCY family transposase [Kiritimatiellae bacterium]|nr:ISNCY family transposase [Kiritimatiellia bacterium]
MKLDGFDQLIRQFRKFADELPDRRRGKNRSYSMADIFLSAFAVFFTQCPSFLARQKEMQQQQGQSNAQTLFQIEDIPSDNHIRQMLDPIAPEQLLPVYDAIYEAFREQGALDTFRGVHNTTLIALDGTWYFSSENIHCDKCSRIEHKSGGTTYYHSAITPVIVAPGQNQALPLRPEFIVPQDGHDKQDCEITAAKRWLEKNGAFYRTGNAVILGDDLYAHQPFCRRVALYGYHYIFTCKPDSHVSLYQWLALLPANHIRTIAMRVKNKRQHWENHVYRYFNGAPLADGDSPLKVNWCEVTVANQSGQQVYHNAFITDFEITDENVSGIIESGRARWKIENENNNTLKTKGYHLEHNFGHGKQHLSSLLAAMNILAFLFHAFLAFCDQNYKFIRAALPTRKTFFNDLRALLRYMCFPSWNVIMVFMRRGIEYGPQPMPPLIA